MPLPELALALLVLLLTPGPTNTLYAVAGSERGFRAALWLVPVAMAAYLVTTLPLTLTGEALLAQHPGAKPVITGIAALWVAWLALRLWQLPAALPGSRGVRAADIFVTTLLNPKALIIGLVLLPADTALLPRFALFMALDALVSSLWIGVGVALQAGPAGPATRQSRLQRAAAIWLGLLATLLAARALAG